MTFAERVRTLLPFLRDRSKLPADQVRNLQPIRNPAVKWQREGEENLVMIWAPLAPLQGWRKALAQFVGEPAGKKIELSDEIAGAVWELCDGENTVRDICRNIGKIYRLGERETEVSVLAFLNMLRARKLVGVPAATSKTAEQAQTGQRTNNGNILTKPKRQRSRGRRH